MPSTPMNPAATQLQAGRLARAFSLAAARSWVLAPRAVTLVELVAGQPLRTAEGAAGPALEQGAGLIAYFVRRERIVMPAAIVLIGGQEIIDWARANAKRSPLAIGQRSWVEDDGDHVLVLEPAGGLARA